MSYMNDNCDPFGTPYPTPTVVEEDKECSFEMLEELRKNESKLNRNLANIRRDKENTIEQLKNKIKKYFEANANIECDKHCNWKITVKTMKLEKLESLKKDFNLKDIIVECCRERNCYGKKEEMIKIKLIT